MKSNCKGCNSITEVTLACPDHSRDCWVLSWRYHRKGDMSAGRDNDTVAILRQNGNLWVWLGNRRTQAVRSWLLDLEHPILKAGHVPMFLVSPKPKVKPDVPCPSLHPSLWFDGQMDHIILCNGSHSVSCHGTVWDNSVKKETRD